MPVRFPVPVRLAVCVLGLALSVTVRIPFRVPTLVGVNVTSISHVAPAPKVCGDRGQLDVSAKSPDVAIEEMVSADA